METLRNVWGPEKGRFIVDLSWSPVQADSVVLVSASEYHLADRPDLLAD